MHARCFYSDLLKKPPALLSALPSLMTRFGQKLSMLVLSHLFSAFFYNTAQLITSFR
jgi:hypothetical protein